MSHRDSSTTDRNQPSQPDWSKRSAQILAGVAVIVLLVVGFNLGNSTSPTPQRPPGTSLEAAGFPEGQTPEPYYYDETNDRWWHESNGHGHWHPGPPPPEDQRDGY